MFFVTGLPRSGTTWFATMANLAAPGQAFCFHEPKQTYEDLNRILYQKEFRYEHVGICDSSLCTYYEDYIVPGDPMLVILREPADVRNSIDEILGYDSTHLVEKMVEMVETIKHDNIKTIEFEDLFTDKIFEVLDFLLEGAEIDKDLVRFIQTCNVQRNKDYIQMVVG